MMMMIMMMMIMIMIMMMIDNYDELIMMTSNSWGPTTTSSPGT